MPDTTPVIIKKSESGLMSTMPRPRPDAVIVLSYNGGGLKTFRHAPNMSDRAGSRWYYVVDVSQRFSSGELTIPARGDVYFFQAWFDAGWQVSDPEEVVRNNIEYGEPVVSGFLSDALWRRGRSHDPDDAQGAEEEILRSVRPPVSMGGGLVLTALNVRLTLDEREAGATATDIDEARTGRRQAEKIRRMRGLVDGDESFLLMHLSEHPGDTGTVLQMLMQARERNDKVRLELLDRMLKEGFIQDADIGPLRDSVLGGGGSIPALPSGTPQPTHSGPVYQPPAYQAPAYQAPAHQAPGSSAPYPGPATAPVPGPDAPQDQPATAVDPDADPPVRPAPSDGVAGWRDLRDRGPRRGSP